MDDDTAGDPPGSDGPDDLRGTRGWYDPAGTPSPSATIVALLAGRPDVDADSCWHSLYDSIDPEALDALFRPRYDGTPRRGGTVSFVAVGYRVTVSADGGVRIDPAAID
ncbi:HalOD1 output domain-containing protein [Natrononativus amylolyticus]|uniref:HalOD1 output domain-containing protein n=1 Tax=Natrononativus amylolyticus TaxID=2963434 RepID=UPI0020CDB936|nr:HalOD1 output domain-containing protein [Natrononativus amylolyticus]